MSVMQRSSLTLRDRVRAIVAVVIVHVGILLAVLGAGKVGLAERTEEPPIETFDVIEPMPPPPVVEQVQAEPEPREEGAASKPNLESQATPVVAPPPRIELPRPTPVVATETPAQGSQPTQGAAPIAGPGTGAGGSGTGTGSGGAGAGAGSGGGGTGQGGRPTLVSRSLRAGDYPRELRQRWPFDGRVLVTFSVQLNGRASGCTVYTSSGDTAIDQETCQLVERKLRFRPARDAEGRPYVAWYGYVQAPVNF